MDDGIFDEFGVAEDVARIFGPAALVPEFPDVGALPGPRNVDEGTPVGEAALNRGRSQAVVLTDGNTDVVGREVLVGAGRLVVDECLDGGVDALAWRSSGPEVFAHSVSAPSPPSLGPSGRAGSGDKQNSMQKQR